MSGINGPADADTDSAHRLTQKKETDNPKPNGAHVSDRGREGGRPGRARSPTVIPVLLQL